MEGPSEKLHAFLSDFSTERVGLGSTNQGWVETFLEAKLMIPSQTYLWINQLNLVDGGWGFWGPWGSHGPCSTTDGRGTISRTRSCDSPQPQHGGQACQGPASDRKNCTNIGASCFFVNPGQLDDILRTTVQQAVSPVTPTTHRNHHKGLPWSIT